jgi:hypothetical protein
MRLRAVAGIDWTLVVWTSRVAAGSADEKERKPPMVGSARPPHRKPRLRTELSEADEARLQEAVVLFGLPKAEVVRRLIRASVQAGPALSAENTRVVVELAQQVRMVGRNLSQVLRAVHEGRAVGIEESEPVWRGLYEVVATINEELTEMTVAYGSRLRRGARVDLPNGVSGEGGGR